MNLSSYGLVILIQRMVVPVHFMDLRLILATFRVSPSTLGLTSDYPLGDEPVHYVDLQITPLG